MWKALAVRALPLFLVTELRRKVVGTRGGDLAPVPRSAGTEPALNYIFKPMPINTQHGKLKLHMVSFKTSHGKLTLCYLIVMLIQREDKSPKLNKKGIADGGSNVTFTTD